MKVNNVEVFRKFLMNNLNERNLEFFDLEKWLEDLEKSEAETASSWFEIPRFDTRHGKTASISYDVEYVEDCENQFETVVTF